MEFWIKHCSDVFSLFLISYTELFCLFYVTFLRHSSTLEECSCFVLVAVHTVHSVWHEHILHYEHVYLELVTEKNIWLSRYNRNQNRKRSSSIAILCIELRPSVPFNQVWGQSVLLRDTTWSIKWSSTLLSKFTNLKQTKLMKREKMSGTRALYHLVYNEPYQLHANLDNQHKQQNE